MNKHNFLKAVNIFSGLRDDEIEHISQYLKSVEIRKDDKLFNQGDVGNELYIVESGIISSLIKTIDGMQKEMAQFKPGDFFGEMAIFENAPRSAACIALNDSRLFIMHKNDFLQIIEKYPSTAIKIMHRMLNTTSLRLRNTGKFLSEMVRWGNEASRRAITDELTGVYNRRYLDNALKDYFQSSLNHGKPLSLAMIDLDNFRDINEAYGHETGNKLIVEAATVFKSMHREKDVIARYGGDEFTVILPETDLNEAKIVAEKVRLKVTEIDILKNLEGPDIKISLSMGIASFPQNTRELKTLKELADKSLYKAKEEGRNRVVLCENEI